MGTIQDMDEEYFKAIKEGTPLDILYLRDMHKMHLCRREINDKRRKYIMYSYVFLYASFLLPLILYFILYIRMLSITNTVSNMLDGLI